MATHRPNISNTAKKRLRSEVGQKCANPGCPNRRTHIHHIREWAVYQTHDEEHMIAVCPSCHDAIHHGDILINDGALYRWKLACRQVASNRTHLYIEPGRQSKVLLGTIAVAAPSSALIFELSHRMRLKFTIKNEDILLLELTVATLSDDEVLRVVDNHICYKERSDIQFNHVPGAIEVLTPAGEEFLPAWALHQMQIQEPRFGSDGNMHALSISVIKPGVVRVQGVWAQRDRAVIVTEERLSFLRPNLKQPLSLVGEGENSVFYYAASSVINVPLFGFE